MTHEDLRARLPAYAAGVLIGPSADVVRLHLAGGCSECLHDLYARPVGFPRVPISRVRAPAWCWAVASAVVGIALAGTLGWLVARVRAPRPSPVVQVAPELTSRLAALEAERDGLAASLAEERRARAAAPAAREAVVAAGREVGEPEPAAVAPDARVAALTREVSRRDAEIARLAARAEARGALQRLAARPGLRVLPLRSVRPFREPAGQLLWNPEVDVAVLSVSALPRVPEAGLYRVRLGAPDGTPVAAADLGAVTGGSVTLPVPVSRGASIGVVEVVREPAGDVVLSGRSAD
ncbi:MAG: hypothetical protein U0807_03385 [Candidatus Binatia bacterium]